MKRFSAVLIFLFLTGFATAGTRYECSYFQHNGQNLLTEAKCLTYMEDALHKKSEGDALISRNVVINASYDENGLAYLFSPVGIFYFTKSGLARKALNFDNGPDYFSNGMARTERNGKIGFFDKKLSIVIEPRYDFAYPFKNGISIVCLGCIRKKDGEHTKIVGGKWGAINIKGEIIQSIVHSESELKALLK